MSKTGQLIVVTGANGSGKSTTCRAFVTAAEDLWLHFGADLFLGQMVPRQYVDGGPRCAEGVHMVPVDPGDPAGPARLSLGTLGAGMMRTLHEMVRAAVQAGQNVIMDHITTIDPPVLHDCVARLHELRVLFVALRPPENLRYKRIDRRLEEAAGEGGLDREHVRLANERTKRVSRYMDIQIFSHKHFDLVIDNATMSPRDVAKAIRDRLSEGPGTAFEVLSSSLDIQRAPFDAPTGRT